MSVEVETEPDHKYVFYAIRPTVEFKVKTVCNAFVMLSNDARPAEGDSLIEVFLGTLANTESAIRTNRSKADTTTVKTANILSPLESRGFWITFGGNTIEVGKEKETKPFMTRSVSASMTYCHMGICSGYGAEGEWVISGETFRTEGNLEYRWLPLIRHLLVNVQAEKNAIVALTSGPSDANPIYEVAIGGWDNMAVAIRYNKKLPEKAFANIPSLLSKDGSASFRLYFQRGLVQLTKADETKSLLEWQDPRPFNVTHFGVRSRTKAKWTIKVVSGISHRKQVPEPPLEWVKGPKDGLPAKNLVEACSWDVEGESVDVYVARAFYEDAFQPAFTFIHRGMSFTYTGDFCEVHRVYRHEFLTGTNFKWQPSQNGDIPFNAVVGGFITKDGSPIFIGRKEGRVGRIMPGEGCYDWTYNSVIVQFSDKAYDILLQE